MAAAKGAMTSDRSNGYEEIAPIFISTRGRSGGSVGVSVVAEWSKSLAPEASILDLGCGTGVPISQVLIEHGFQVYGVDASESMIAAFRARFPMVPVECAAAEDSHFFGRSFDGVVAWGLFFLLAVEVQLKLVEKIAAVLPVGGRLLFTAPSQVCSWSDAMTGRTSSSLGHEAYVSAMERHGMSLVGTYVDEGENYYYSAQKR